MNTTHESLKDRKNSRQEKRLEGILREEMMYASKGCIDLSEKLVEAIASGKDLTYQEVYQALEITYLTVESQSIFASVSPVTLKSVVSEKTNR